MSATNAIPQTHSVQRSDIQALRALAILAVVIYHFWPSLLPGGYLGVDIFFVISGYLITGLIYRELIATGRLDFSRFWSRRVRRLLPAALTTISLTAIAGFFFAPITWQSQSFGEALASIFYVENWYLGINAVDYLAEDKAISPYQHYWSLSVEEQFYILWPIALVIGFLLFRKSKLALKILIALALVLGYLHAIYMDNWVSEFSFFSTFSRVWEFAIGALIAVLGISIRNRMGLLVHLAGFALMVIGLVIANRELAVIGAALALASVVVIFDSVKPLIFIGDISYSWYLWHWPVLLLAPWVIGRSLDQSAFSLDGFGLIVISIMLATASKFYVEDPLRFGSVAKLKALTQIGLGFIAMLLSAAVVLVISVSTSAMQLGSYSESLSPALSELDDAYPIVENVEYRIGRDRSGFLAYEFGDGQSDIKIALVGDSHARQYFETLERLALENSWSLTVISKSACSVQNPDNFGLIIEDDTCLPWNQDLREHLENSDYDLLINSNSSAVNFKSPDSATSYVQELSYWRELGYSVITIWDNPKPNFTDDVNNFRVCIEQNQEQAATACAISVADANTKPDDLAAAAAAAAANDNDWLVLDFTDVYCPDGLCSPIIENRIVYRDSSHLTVDFVELLEPELESAIQELIDR